MKRRILGLAVCAAAPAAALAVAVAAQPSAGRGPWGACCGLQPWPQRHGAPGSDMMGGQMGPGMMGPGRTGAGHDMARHHLAMISGVPAPYAGQTNPLPHTRATLDHGAQVYAANCATCHGPNGHGDGPTARGLTPPPADLAWLSGMPMAQWDAYMAWTVAEGGAPVGSAMPAFKDSLPENDRWAAIAYIQARLPPPTGG